MPPKDYNPKDDKSNNNDLNEPSDLFKKCKGKIYTQGFKGLKFENLPTKIVFSQPNGNKEVIKKFTYDR